MCAAHSGGGSVVLRAVPESDRRVQGGGGGHTSGESSGHPHQKPQRSVWVFTQQCHWVYFFFFLRKYIFKGIYVKEIALYIRVLIRASLTVVNH